MVSMDIFRNDAFSTMELTAAVERNPFMPAGISELNLFTPAPQRVNHLAVEERNGVLTLIQTSQRGAPLAERTTEKRKMRYFDIPRIAKEDTIQAQELQGIRQFGTETELMQVQAEAARRLAGPTGLQAHVAYTKERMRLAAVQGILVDADDSVLYNWFDEFEVSQDADDDWVLGSGTANSIRPKCNAVIRAMARAGQGAFVPGTKVYALCGDDWYDELTNHPDVIRTFLNWSDGRDIRDGDAGAAFDVFKFGGIYWWNYRGSDDNTTVKVAANKAKFFPVGAPGVFQEAQGPGEAFDWINTPGKPEYVIPIIDRDRNMWFKQEIYAYPLPICTRPEMLLRATTSN